MGVFDRVLRVQPQVCLVEAAGPSFPAAADTFATSHPPALESGGCLLAKNLQPGSIRWFCISISASDLPDWFLADNCSQRGLASLICAFEARAQLVLLAHLGRAGQRPLTCGACRAVAGLRQHGGSWRSAKVCLHVPGVVRSFASTGRALESAGRPACLSYCWYRDCTPDFWADLSPQHQRRADWQALLGSGQAERVARALA